MQIVTKNELWKSVFLSEEFFVLGCKLYFLACSRVWIGVDLKFVFSRIKFQSFSKLRAFGKIKQIFFTQSTSHYTFINIYFLAKFLIPSWLKLFLIKS